MTTARETSIQIDDRELRQLEIDLAEAPKRIQLGIRKPMRRSADIVEAGMKKDARGHRYLPRFPRAITSELIDRYTAEIGFETTRGTQGRLAHIILYGSVNNLPVYDYTAALRRSIPAILDLFATEAEDDTLGSREA